MRCSSLKYSWSALARSAFASVVVSMLVPYGVAEAALEQGFLDLSAWNAEEEPTLRVDGIFRCTSLTMSF